jgi:hypothetical protein
MKRFLLTLAFAAIATLTPAARAADPVNVGGGGQVLVTDIFGGQYAAAFSIAGVLTPNGKANGSVGFVFGADFGAVWGVFPEDTDAIHVYGKITGVTVAGDGTITLTGEVTEVDLSHADGVIFAIAGEPFEMVIDPDRPDEFTFTWCLLPEFGADVTRGGIAIR